MLRCRKSFLGGAVFCWSPYLRHQRVFVEGLKYLAGIRNKYSSVRLKRAEVQFFIWIKGGANFEPMTPVHKKRVLMRLIFLSLEAFAENDRIAF